MTRCGKRDRGGGLNMDERGFTLVEIIVAAVITSAIVLFATGASSSITGAAGYGSRKLQVEADCQEILHFLANDLQNASSDSDPVTLVPRFEVEESTAVKELTSVTALTVAENEVVEELEVTGDESLENRPRANVYVKNSHFSFQKVHDLDVDPVKGEVTPIWSSPIEYYLKDRNLIREHNGHRRVVATNVSVFRVVAQPQGNFRVFVRIQKRNPANGEVLTASGMIEVNPKNS